MTKPFSRTAYFSDRIQRMIGTYRMMSRSIESGSRPYNSKHHTHFSIGERNYNNRYQSQAKNIRV